MRLGWLAPWRPAFLCAAGWHRMRVWTSISATGTGYIAGCVYCPHYRPATRVEWDAARKPSGKPHQPNPEGPS